MNHSEIARISNADLLSSTRALAARSHEVEADLLVHLVEIDERKLYADLGHSSLFGFCTRELGFSEGATSNRILVARAARKLPAILDAARTGRVHLTGLRMLAPHLTAENCERVLAAASHKTVDEIKHLVAKLVPRPAVETTVRKLPAPRPLPFDATPWTEQVAARDGAQRSSPTAPAPAGSEALPAVDSPTPGCIVPSLAPTPPRSPAVVTPLAEDLYRIQFTAPKAFRDKLRQAQDLAGDDALSVLSAALDLFVERRLKDRIGAGKSRPAAVDSGSRYIPAATRRAVWERDGGRCAFVGVNGTRCAETRSLEFDHIDGFARTHRHDASSMRLLCRTHNQLAADALYGRAFMDQKRSN